MVSPCIKRHCGGTYSTGGQWEPVIITCPTDYIACEWENLVKDALNNTEVSVFIITSYFNIYSFINTCAGCHSAFICCR